VPDVIVSAPAVPRTLSGKKLEVPVKRILMGEEVARVVNPGSLANPEALEFYVEYARRKLTWAASAPAPPLHASGCEQGPLDGRGPSAAEQPGQR
jgi:acetoacetyl-CoA synthetase